MEDIRTTHMSKDQLSVGKLSASHGEKRCGVNEFLVEGQPYRLPMWLINGVGEGPTLVVTAGVHAAEYASIAAALELGRSLDPASLSGCVIVVPIVDMPAFTARSIYVCPLDGKNPNRVFPGNPQGSASEDRRLGVSQRNVAGHSLCRFTWRRPDRSIGAIHDFLSHWRQAR